MINNFDNIKKKFKVLEPHSVVPPLTEDQPVITAFMASCFVTEYENEFTKMQQHLNKPL